MLFLTARRAVDMNKRLVITGTIAFVAGVAVGGYLFTKSLPRSFLAFSDCRSSCYRPNDLAGLVVSAGIQRAHGLIPDVLKESDKCLAIRHPVPSALHHFVIFPKKDIKSIGEIAPEDAPDVVDCIALIGALTSEYGLRRYDVLTNGPGLQDVTYLHFHVRSWEQKK